MRLLISEAAKLTGLSVRTLHYYDEMGLLKPCRVAENGYRYYGDSEISRLQQILFFRELGFPLKEIKDIMSTPGYDQTEALKRHKNILLMNRERIDGLIGLIEKILNGDENMSFKEFDMSQIEEEQKKYAEETRRRWGGTKAYEESEKRTAQYSKDDWQTIQQESDEIFSSFAEMRDREPSDAAVQELVGSWQDLITRYFYECTLEILSGLGEMYVLDERFKENIDKYGKGTAELMSRAIGVYCDNKLR